MGQPNLMLYSLVIQQPDPLFKLNQPAVMLLVMLADKHTGNACSLSDPSSHAARGVPAQDALVRTPLWSMMMKFFLSGNGHRDPKQANGNDSGQLALSLPVFPCPSDSCFPPRPERSDYLDNEGWRWQEDIRALADRHHVLSPMGFKRQKQNPLNLPNKTHLFHVCLASKPCGNPLQAQVAPDVRRTYPVNPPNTMSYLFLAQVHPPNNLRTFWLEFTVLRPTLMIPRAIVHKSFNRISLEHSCLLHMIPFVVAPGILGGTNKPPSPGTGGLSKGGHHQDSLQMSRKKNSSYSIL
ncbi:hypothetical protein O181_020842 [Austropuccinia psidii MF-1]|uniref:Uncharacterized protein n=1 Tax=Austropuccinia psidii MF-1 TaxID=1389203 RepID=A0A9Q3CEB0_9BASI|nr:hypothetical protein [Austropuccinia psidii MF-1]